MRTRVYVDGFNLYYGALRRRPGKWLNLAALCDRLLPGCQVEQVRYFTARVSARPHDLQQAARQDIYFRALRTEPRHTIHLGHFLSKRATMPDAAAWEAGRFQPVDVWKTEEKGSDVNLATHLLVDGFDGTYERAVVLSNDSDLCEPVRVVTTRLGRPVDLINPHERPSRALARLVGRITPLTAADLAAAQFPDRLVDATGAFHKPPGW